MTSKHIIDRLITQVILVHRSKQRILYKITGFTIIALQYLVIIQLFKQIVPFITNVWQSNLPAILALMPACKSHDNWLLTTRKKTKENFNRFINTCMVDATHVVQISMSPMSYWKYIDSSCNPTHLIVPL